MTVVPKRPSGLFPRIFGTFVVTVIAAVITASVGTWFVAEQMSQRWVADTIAVLDDERDTLVAALAEPLALERHTAALSSTLGARVAVYGLDGTRLAGHGRPHLPRGTARARRLGPARTGRQESVDFDLVDPDTQRVVAIVRVDAARPGLALPILVSSGLVLALLGLGARALSRSFTRRLERLEQSAERITRGELGHRVLLEPAAPRDEIDELGIAWNAMAETVQTLVVRQQHLLANVSHELRTPIARLKVLLEILEERVDALRKRSDPDDLERLTAGLSDMRTDTEEIERLIADLLTSGRLELRAGARSGLERSLAALGPLLERMASRFGVAVTGDRSVAIEADAILIERLASNLLTNAKRACPDGAVTLHVQAQADRVLVVVEDEGPGIAPTDRERIFEPFQRLDEARSRDHGGVGLGLHLCRQIARAHGGDIVALARADGRPGARFEVTLARAAESPSRPARA